MKEFIIEVKSKEVIDYFKAHNHEEIIRCRDCQFINRPIPQNGVPFCTWNKRFVSPGCFCADGIPIVRKES